MRITKSHLRKIIREAIQEERGQDWNYTLTQIVDDIGPEQALLDFVGAIFMKEDLAEKMLSAILHILPEPAIKDGVAYLSRSFSDGSFKDDDDLEEKLSRKEKAKRKKRRIFGKAPEDDTGVPDEIEALGRGIVGNRSDDEELEENECAGNPYRSNSGRYSSHREPGSYTLPKKPKNCRTKSGQGRRAAGSRDNDKSEKPCGRKKKKDGSQTKCRDGSPRG
jgi:hypothetical protein